MREGTIKLALARSTVGTLHSRFGMGTTNVVRAANAEHDPKWPDEQLAVSVDAFSVELGNVPATAWHVTT